MEPIHPKPAPHDCGTREAGYREYRPRLPAKGPVPAQGQGTSPSPGPRVGPGLDRWGSSVTG